MHYTTCKGFFLSKCSTFWGSVPLFNIDINYRDINNKLIVIDENLLSVPNRGKSISLFNIDVNHRNSDNNIIDIDLNLLSVPLFFQNQEKLFFFLSERTQRIIQKA